MSRSSRTGTVPLAVTLAAAVVAGCTSSHTSARTHSASPQASQDTDSTVTALTTGATPDPHAPSVSKAPNLAEESVPALVSAASLSKNTEFALKGGIRSGKTLAIAVNCKGTGTMTVAITPSGLSFPLHCSPTQVTPTVNEIRFASQSKEARITFTLSAMSDLTWSFAAGWDPHPAQLDQGDQD